MTFCDLSLTFMKEQWSISCRINMQNIIYCNFILLQVEVSEKTLIRSCVFDLFPTFFSTQLVEIVTCKKKRNLFGHILGVHANAAPPPHRLRACHFDKKVITLACYNPERSIIILNTILDIRDQLITYDNLKYFIFYTVKRDWQNPNNMHSLSFTQPMQRIPIYL